MIVCWVYFYGLSMSERNRYLEGGQGDSFKTLGELLV